MPSTPDLRPALQHRKTISSTVSSSPTAKKTKNQFRSGSSRSTHCSVMLMAVSVSDVSTMELVIIQVLLTHFP